MTINQVSRKFNIPEYTLRYWEQARILSPVAKNAQGHRNYTIHNINEIKFAILMRNSGIGIKSLIKFMRLLKNGT